MRPDLRYLVHFFNDVRYLFETLTMVEASRADEICDVISACKGWYWVRYSASERHGYLKRRAFVEEAMYSDYTRAYGSLKDSVPVYFYLVPDLSDASALEMARQRAARGETEPRVLLVETRDIADMSNVTFTVNDSHTAYRRRGMAAGLDFGGAVEVPHALPDHDRTFPFSMIERVHRRYEDRPISYEVQVWDRRMLEELPRRILKSGREIEVDQ